MKRLLLVRHAKSDWTHDLPDFDRPLNERGHKDAPKMARFLQEQDIQIEQFVSSPAKRAITTARYFAESFGNSKIQKIEDLYEPHFEDFENTILRLDDAFSCVALFSHNPGISEYATNLCNEIIEFPTCGVAVIKIETNQWSQLLQSEKKLEAFYKPKEI